MYLTLVKIIPDMYLNSLKIIYETFLPGLKHYNVMVII